MKEELLDGAKRERERERERERGRPPCTRLLALARNIIISSYADVS